ncbi:hypothetical protein GOBAR_AA06678 [Gossypium barbadense]|uniref:FH2 domain-containing protein n=1 Tax=Gossypium barbadense TaxID=3634 RepID=A0A2P5YE77_GOSBA|nr:hypothetical protein GOBAR_AA06678 [Gossypium barbadense]
MDDTVLDVDQVENLIKFCPTKEEMELLKNYTGDKESLEKCEQSELPWFLVVVWVLSNSKMRKRRKEWADNVSFKNDESATSRVKTKSVLFQDSVPNSGLAVSEFKRSLNTVNSACNEAKLESSISKEAETKAIRVWEDVAEEDNGRKS